MTVELATVTGSVKIVAVGAAGALMRGRPAEFRHHGLAVTPRATAVEALVEVGREPDSVVLVPTDIQDMQISQFVEVLRSLAHVPVIAGIGRDSTPQQVSELYDQGVSGTVSLPATPGRLAASVHSVRGPMEADPPLCIGDLVLDPASHRVTWHGFEVVLAARNFELVRYMMTAYPRVIPLDELRRHLGDRPAERAIRSRSAISRIRTAFAEACPDQPPPLETVHRVGYRLSLHESN